MFSFFSLSFKTSARCHLTNSKKTPKKSRDYQKKNCQYYKKLLHHIIFTNFMDNHSTLLMCITCWERITTTTRPPTTTSPLARAAKFQNARPGTKGSADISCLFTSTTLWFFGYNNYNNLLTNHLLCKINLLWSNITLKN